MAYLGVLAPSSVVYFNFTTLDTTVSPAVPYALSGGTVSVYKDDNTTESTSGVTLTASFDSKTGLNNVKIDTSSDGTFYASGHFFQAILTAGTVNGTTVVSYVLDSFYLLTGGSSPTAAAIRAEMDSNSTQLSGIKEKTDNLPASPASTTNITAGTITTVTNLTNAPTSGDLTSTMKTSVTTAVTGASVNATQFAGQTITAAAGVTLPSSVASPTNITAASGVALTSAYDAAKTASQAGDTMKVSNGTGTGQVSLSSGAVLLQATQTGVTIPTVTTLTNDPSGVTTLLNRVGSFTGSGINTILGFLKAIMKKDAAATPSDVGGTYDNTVDSLQALQENGLSGGGTVTVGGYSSGQAPLQPTVAGRTLDVTTTGEAGIDWNNIGAPTTTVNLSNTTIKTTQKVDVDTIKTNPVVNAGTVTFPTGATLASTTNITAATGITVTTNSDKTAYHLAVPSDLANDTAARASMEARILAIFNALLNEGDQDGTQRRHYNDAGSVFLTLSVSQVSGTQHRGKSA